MGGLKVAALGAGVQAAAVAVLAFMLLLVNPLHAQDAELNREENFRLEPNGGVLAVLSTGTSLEVLQQRDNWYEAVMEGWVWAQSLIVTERGGFDLVVALDGGENLRDRPQGAVLGRLADGTLLEEVERIPGWIRVRRRGWIWAASVDAPSATSSAAQSTPTSSAPSTSPPPARPSSTSQPPATSQGEASTAGRAVLRARALTPLLSGPGGDTLTAVRPGTDMIVTRRDGNWVRVQIEGWVLQPAEGEPGGAELMTEELGPEQVAADPAGMRGRVVSWELQFVSLERAEAVRTDFYEGEPYLLMRPVGDGPARFVYVAIPEERVADIGRFAPLERLVVQGRVRTGSSALTGSPVLDLVEMTRRR